jgi:hypothetical protein
MKVIAKVETPDSLALFLPEMPAVHGRICYWSPAEGHGEASMDYYIKNTRRPSIKHEPRVEILMEKYARIYDCTVERVFKDTRAFRFTRWDVERIKPCV